MTIDFIIKLPKLEDPITKDRFDLILLIVDKLTKYIILILYKETYNTEQLRFLFLDQLVKNNSVPKDIISDRDKLFTLRY